jgi:hypothetical protein
MTSDTSFCQASIRDPKGSFDFFGHEVFTVKECSEEATKKLTVDDGDAFMYICHGCIPKYLTKLRADTSWIGWFDCDIRPEARVKGSRWYWSLFLEQYNKANPKTPLTYPIPIVLNKWFDSKISEAVEPMAKEPTTEEQIASIQMWLQTEGKTASPLVTLKKKKELRDLTAKQQPQNPIETMIWQPWTDKSNAIPFKSTTTGVGDGEEKVARELGATVLGQNSVFDMEPVLNGVKTPCDVKKLDTQNDFNTGVKGRNALRSIKQKHSHLLESLYTLSQSSFFTQEETAAMTWFSNVSPDEIAAESTLPKLNNVCFMLNATKKKILASLPTVQPFTNPSGPVSMPLDLYYTICERTGQTFPSEYAQFEEAIKILRILEHVYINEPQRFMEDLNSLTRIFSEITLIIVHEQKGYMFINDITKIKFYRITRGHPRFKILF